MMSFKYIFKLKTIIYLHCPYLRSFLFKLLDSPLVNATTLVDEVARGGGLARVHMTDHNDIDVEFLLSHDDSTGAEVTSLSTEAGVRLQSAQYTDGWQSREKETIQATDIY